MPKTLLLLGGAADQLYAVKTAQAMGIKTVVVDMNPKAPGLALADHSAVVSTRDDEALKEFASEYEAKHGKIDGVLVMGSDIPQHCSRLAQYLGAPHIPEESALVLTEKFRMKQVFAKNGIPVPDFALVSSRDEVEAFGEKVGWPIVIKPVDRSGARGVFFLNGPENSVLFEDSRSESLCGEVLAEKFVRGSQVSSESIVIDGKLHTPGFVDRNYEFLDRFSPRIIENGGWQPSRLNAAIREEMEQLISKVAEALDIKNGVLKGDLVYCPQEGAKVIEVAGRLSGGDFSESLVPLGTGVDYVRAAILQALGEEIDESYLEESRNYYVANRYFFVPGGEVTSISGVAEINDADFIKKFELWYEEGDQVPELTSHADRFGVFVVVAESEEELEKRIDWVYGQLRVECA